MTIKNLSVNIPQGILSGALASMLYAVPVNTIAQGSQITGGPNNATNSAADVVKLGEFSQGLGDWTEIRLDPSVPANQFSLEQWDNKNAVKVQSTASMSLLARKVDMDLSLTPLLCWQWRVESPVRSADMTQRSGDDYAARLYVSLSLPAEEKGFLLNTQLAIARAIWGPDVPDAAINYVWDNKMPPGTQQPNVYTDRATMVVLRSGQAQAGQWVSESRNLLQDMAALYSANATVTQIAFGADTDNTGESATAGFANLHLASVDGCQFDVFTDNKPEARPRR